ncbi:MAG: endonuclease/exonuclease/phosphatase family protein [Clostridia bacterium]|nr:endonuclease/exonuclease/phosphatase family protein [Clostridia bacterium]
MKLLTLNTHSLMESNHESNYKILANVIEKRNIDIIALQEIMQPINGATMCNDCLGIPLKKGNYASLIMDELNKNGIKYNLLWLGFKKSYNSFDEGLAIICKGHIEETRAITLTPFDDYNNWKTRKALGAKIDGKWYICVHMGWWDDKEAPFEQQFCSLVNELPVNEEIYLLGDFNLEENQKNEGYDLVISKGFYDTYSLALDKDNGMTAHSQIDGWNKEKKQRQMRIDYIFTNKMKKIQSSFTIFNGENEEIISDHFGIIVTL